MMRNVVGVLGVKGRKTALFVLLRSLPSIWGGAD